MIPPADFWAETEQLIQEKAITARQAQRRGDAILATLIREFESFTGYRVLFIGRAIKRRQRLLEKAKSIRQNEQNVTPQQIVSRIRDFAGGRILVIGLGDILLVHKYFSGSTGSGGSYTVAGDPKAFVENAKDGGFRGLIQDLDITLDGGERFPYEVQVLTYFQHSWDQLQHGIYELMRIGAQELVPAETSRAFEDLSAKLYELDRTVDELRRKATTEGHQLTSTETRAQPSPIQVVAPTDPIPGTTEVRTELS